MRRLWACLLLPILLPAADIAVAPQSLTFAYQWRSALLPAQQGLVITSPDRFTFTLSRPVNDQWLALPNGSNTVTADGPVFVPINADPLALGPGSYSSTLTLRTSQGAFTIPVAFTISVAPVMATDRGILGFDAASSLLVVATGMSNGSTLTASPSTTTPWLTVRGGPFNFFASADADVAGPALRAGSLLISGFSIPPPINSPLVVPVVHMGTGLASPPPLTPQPGAVAFTGSGTQTLTVTGGTFTATDDAAWLSTTAAGQTLTLTANATGLAEGSYQATVVLNSGGVLQAVPVSLALGPPSLTKVVNSASYADGGIAPGEVVLLGGANIGPGVLTGLALDANGFVSSTLAGVRVTFNDVAAPLVYVSATVVAAVAPYELDGSATAAVQVTVGGRASNVLTVPVVATAPGIFTANASGTGPAASFRTGDVVSIYLTGHGQTTPSGVNGRVTTTPPVPLRRVTASIDGQPAEVLFAGEAPGIVSGVMQVNLRPAAGVRSGPVPVVVEVGGVAAQGGVTVSAR